MYKVLQGARQVGALARSNDGRNACDSTEDKHLVHDRPWPSYNGEPWGEDPGPDVPSRLAKLHASLAAQLG